MTPTDYILEQSTVTTSIALADTAINNNQRLSEKILSLVAGTPGPYALVHQHAYLFERIRDVKIILNRLKQNRALITELAIKEDVLRPKKRIRYGKPPSKRLQPILLKSQEASQQMKLDMECLFVFGNLLLDQWAYVVGYLIGADKPHDYKFATFVDKVQTKKGDKGLLQPLWDKHRNDILWLFYQLRMYRNVFVEHMNIPLQRGTNRQTYGDDFKLFSPAPVGWLDESEIDEAVRSIAHLAPDIVKSWPDTYWEKADKRRLLEIIFHNIDGIEEQVDRQTVWGVWQKVGGLTSSYDEIALRLMRFISDSALTVLDMISKQPNAINVGARKQAQ